MTENGLLTVDETAQRLGLSRHQIYRRISSGYIRARLGMSGNRACFLIEEEAISEYIANRSGDRVTVSEPLRTTLSPSEVAVLTGIRADKVREMCDSGELDHWRAATRSGRQGRYRIPREAVDRLIASTL